MNPQVTHIRPQDLNAQQFVVDPTTHKLKALPVSTDANNVVSVGSDGNVFVGAAAIQANQVTYTAAIVGHKINLYQTVPGVGAAAAVTTMVSSLDTTTFDVSVSGGAFSAGVLTLAESNGGPSIQIDLSALLKQVSVANSSSAALAGAGTAASPLTVSVTIDTTIAADAKTGLGNLLKVTTTGVSVSPADVLNLINGNITVGLAVNAAAGTLVSTVNGVSQSVGLTEVLNVDGSHAGWMLS